MKIRFAREYYSREECIWLDDKKYICTDKAKQRLLSCTNDQDYAKQMEYLAYQVFVEHSVENDDLFRDTAFGYPQSEKRYYNSYSQKPKMKTFHKILIGIGMFFVAMLLTVIIGGLITMGFFFHNVEKKVDNFWNGSKKQAEMYDDFLEKLNESDVIKKEWIEVGSTTMDDGGLFPADSSDMYYAYIDEQLYDDYEDYWLGGKSKSKYKEGYNERMREYGTGDYVFHAVGIEKLSFSEDTEYKNVSVLKGKDYYNVKVYNKAVYFGVIDNYGGTTYYCNVDEQSLIKEYICYYSKDELKMIEVDE
ncbi:MAG: hypothetical protein IKN54_09675 [Lachnospiraceae bacterium]|nr:hypothetical protein [Lachnospiraceae bacterium]